MTDDKKSGRNVTIYLSPAREALFEKVFHLMRERSMIPSTAEMNKSRSLIIDHALDALHEKLSDQT